MHRHIALIGFGEAASTFANAWREAGLHANPLAYDRKTSDPAHRGQKIADYAAADILWAENPAGTLQNADVVLCLVTAAQSEEAAVQCAPHLPPGALWLDMNSVAPQAKARTAAIIDEAGGRYVDVAVMAPVNPARLAVPLLLAGPHAPAGLAALQQRGFAGRIVAGPVGTAAGIKMVRSIAIKGLEAVLAECVLIARAAGVEEEVFDSLQASDPELRWRQRAAYALERMTKHGIRRAEEMEQAAAMVESFGLDGALARATAALQRRIGSTGVAARLEAAA